MPPGPSRLRRHEARRHRGGREDLTENSPPPRWRETDALVSACLLSSRKFVHLTKLGLGGRISTGEQWIRWIHIDDLLRAVRFIRDHDDIAGIVHVTAPNRPRTAT